MSAPTLSKYTYRTRRRGFVDATCTHCGVTFVARHRVQEAFLRFCSQACAIARRRANGVKPNVRCLRCKTEFHTPPSCRRVYCSRDCANTHKRESAATRCVWCNVPFTPMQWLKVGARRRLSVVSGLRAHCSQECATHTTAEKLSRIVGPMRPAWKGGTTVDHKKGYRGPGWNAIARSIRKRDGEQCVRCSMTNAAHRAWCGKQLEVHHMIPFHNFTDYRRANKPANLVTLCISCHRKAEAEIEGVQLMLPINRAA